jgi:large subunit ribosomal protein L29
MKASDLRDLSIEELGLKADDLRSELFNLRIQHATNQLENTAKLSLIRKDLARIITVIREKELKEEGVNSG